MKQSSYLIVFHLVVSLAPNFELYSQEDSHKKLVPSVNEMVDKAIKKTPVVYIDEDDFDNQFSHHSNIFNDQIDEIDDEFAKMIIDSAPHQIKRIVARITKPVSPAYMPTRLILLGDPGTGKTTLAKAIAKATKRRYRFVKAPSLLDEYKNSAIQNLDKLFNSLFKSKQDCVLILDEFNVITDLYKTDKYDKESVGQFWQLLDDCRLYKNVLFIGTSNKSYQDFPTQIQTRFIRHRQIITLSKASLNFREELIKHYLKNVNHELSDKFIKFFAKQTNSKTIRELEMLITEVIADAEADRSDSEIILKEKDFEYDLKEWNTWRDWLGDLYQKIKPGVKIFITQGLPTVISILSLYTNQRNFVIQQKTQSNQFALQLALQQQSIDHQTQQANFQTNWQVYNDEKLYHKLTGWKKNKELINGDEKAMNVLVQMSKDSILKDKNTK